MSNASSSEDLAGRLIEHTGRLQRRLRRSYHSSRLTPARMSALAFIVAERTATGGQVAQAEGVTAPTISRILDGLENDGLITRTPSKSDRRIVELRATESGRKTLAETQQWQIEKLASDLSRLEKSERKTLSHALNLIGRLASADSN